MNRSKAYSIAKAYSIVEAYSIYRVHAIFSSTAQKQNSSNIFKWIIMFIILQSLVVKRK